MNAEASNKIWLRAKVFVVATGLLDSRVHKYVLVFWFTNMLQVVCCETTVEDGADEFHRFCGWFRLVEFEKVKRFERVKDAWGASDYFG